MTRAYELARTTPGLEEIGGKYGVKARQVTLFREMRVSYWDKVLTEGGPMLLTADGREVAVIMTPEQFLAMKKAAPAKNPVFKRIEGALYQKVEG